MHTPAWLECHSCSPSTLALLTGERCLAMWPAPTFPVGRGSRTVTPGTMSGRAAAEWPRPDHTAHVTLRQHRGLLSWPPCDIKASQPLPREPDRAPPGCLLRSSRAVMSGRWGVFCRAGRRRLMAIVGAVPCWRNVGPGWAAPGRAAALAPWEGAWRNTPRGSQYRGCSPTRICRRAQSRPVIQVDVGRCRP